MQRRCMEVQRGRPHLTERELRVVDKVLEMASGLDESADEILANIARFATRTIAIVDGDD